MNAYPAQLILHEKCLLIRMPGVSFCVIPKNVGKGNLEEEEGD